MHEQCLVAEFEDRDRANECLELLAKSGYSSDDVSLVISSDDSELDGLGPIENTAGSQTKTAKAATVGGLMGGAISMPFAMTTLIGPVMLAGPIVGIAAGAVLGGALAGTERWGVNKDARQEYEQKIREGAVLVIVSADRPKPLHSVEAIVQTADPISVRRFALPEPTGNTPTA